MLETIKELIAYDVPKCKGGLLCITVGRNQVYKAKPEIFKTQVWFMLAY